MSGDAETLQARIVELQGERATLVAAKSREDLRREVGDWIEIARAQAAGASRLVLGGHASGEHLARVLAEDRLADEGLVDRLVARLEFDGFGQITNRHRSQRLDKLDAAIKRAEMELREARKAAAIEQLEAQFAAESAA
jgi:hypothetical protein